MSLQRIFSSTTIIVGLFISVDYGLCDEFRCRGKEVSSHTAAAAVKGFWGIRALWTLVYVGGLAAFAMFFTLLERHYTTTVIYLASSLVDPNRCRESQVDVSCERKFYGFFFSTIIEKEGWK